MGRRPQKPEGVLPAPRRRTRKRSHQMNAVLNSIRQNLRALTRGVPTTDHLSAIQEQASADSNDRGAAILIATNLENALEYAIESRMQLSDEQREELFFLSDSPASSFNRKIILSDALKLIGPQARLNLDIIRLLRNAFAHTRLPITFETATIKNACDALVLPRLFPQISVRYPLDTDSKERGARNKYRIVCERTSHNLQFISIPTLAGNTFTSDPPHGSESKTRTPQSLP